MTHQSMTPEDRLMSLCFCDLTVEPTCPDCALRERTAWREGRKRYALPEEPLYRFILTSADETFFARLAIWRARDEASDIRMLADVRRGVPGA